MLWCEAPGPLRARLTVRAGWADETLPTRGWSHLVEHLALGGAGRPGDHSNGHTDATSTAYHIEGEPQEVVEFMAHVTSRLADLPTARMEDELGVLRAEQDGRRGWVMDPVVSWRYGARDYGLGPINELGLSVPPDPEAVRHRARTQAGRGNAVLWLSGPPPAGLRLHLPDGDFAPPPDLRRNVAGPLPAWVVGGEHRVAGLAVVRRGWQAAALQHVVAARLLDVLRVDLAVAYSPGADFLPLTADWGWLTLQSDLVGGRQSEGVGPFLRLLEDLAAEEGAPGSLTEAEVEGFRQAARRRAQEPYAWADELNRRAWDRLLHRQAAGGEATDVAVGQVREAAQEAAASFLAMVPPGLGTYRSGWSQAVDSTAEPVVGVEHRGLGFDEVLVGSPDGVSVHVEGVVRTVRRDEVAGVLRWPDGRRVLVGADGTQVVVEPTVLERGGDLVRHVDRIFPPSVVVLMSPRRPGEVPSPAGPRPGSSPGAGARPPVDRRADHTPARTHPWWALFAMVLGTACLLVLVGVLVAEAGGPVEVMGAVTAGAFYGVVRRWRTLYPPRPRP